MGIVVVVLQSAIYREYGANGEQADAPHEGTAHLRASDRVHHAVAQVEVERSQVDDRAIKGLYTRLLFMLSRCSRQLITQEMNMFATEPRGGSGWLGERSSSRRTSMAMPGMLERPTQVPADAEMLV